MSASPSPIGAISPTEEDEIRGPNVPLPSSQEQDFDHERASAGVAEEAGAGTAGGHGVEGEDNLDDLLIGDVDPDPDTATVAAADAGGWAATQLERVLASEPRLGLSQQ